MSKKLKEGTQTKFGIITSPDSCAQCKYDGACEEDVYEFCKKNLKLSHFFI
jgi:hypothetical protein